MSSAIVKKSLELFQDDLKEDIDLPKKKGKTGSAMKLISSKKTGTWKELRRLQKQQIVLRNKRPSQTKSLIETYQESQRFDFTERNLSMLQKMSHTGKLQANQAKKILEHNGRSATQETKPDDTTIFTDADFEKFQQEYDFS